jgi:hypothetical protein
MRSSEGFKVLDIPLIANGPGLALPIAAVFAVAGEGLLQARMVVVAFALLAEVAYFAIARRLFWNSAGNRLSSAAPVRSRRRLRLL